MDSAFVDFWKSKDDTILHMLSELSGIDWLEVQFDIHVVRFFPSIGSGRPLILPLGGIKSTTLTKAAPSGKDLTLNVIFQLARRMLAQVEHPANAGAHPVSYHPLMEPTPYRRDNLAMLLALSVSQNVLGYDTTMAAFNSAFWQAHLPGRQILESHFLKKWALTPQQTLVNWLLAETFNSELVKLTRTPRPPKQPDESATDYSGGISPSGRLGFSISFNDLGQLVVDSVDSRRLAFACGLQIGDRIRAVDGVRVRTHRDLIEKILHGLDQGGALLEVLRGDASQSVLMQPLSLPAAGDSILWQDSTFWLYDSLDVPADSMPPDTSNR
jgi:hypothetical protein